MMAKTPLRPAHEAKVLGFLARVDAKGGEVKTGTPEGDRLANAVVSVARKLVRRKAKK